jgi:PAS domain S-box-containing protein
VGAAPSLRQYDLPELRSLAAGEIRTFETRNEGAAGKKRIALRISVKDTPFSLVCIVDAKDTIGDVNPDQLLTRMAIQALVIFAGLFFIFGLTIRYLILQTRLKDSTIRERDIGEKNRQLEIEILERKRVEKALREKTALLSGLLTSIPDIVFFKDKEGIYLGCNAEFARFVGQDTSNIVGSTDHALFSQEIADSFREQDRIMMDHGEPRHNEEWIDYTDGTRILLDTLKAPLIDGYGQIIGMLGVSRDITVRKQAEEELRLAKEKAERANQAKDDLISNVSHELRTPLASIIGFTTTIFDDKELSEEMREEFLRIVISEGRKLSNLIDDILDLSRIESGKIDFHFGTHEAGALLGEMKRIFQNQFDEKVVKLIIKSPKEDAFITCDESRINQVLRNLISNALKFTPAGGSVFVGVENASNRDIEITVKDTGIGIPEDDIPHIFEKFYRAKHNGVLFSGTGLGLTITKSIIDQHGGSIRVVCAEAAGAAFHVTLPRFTT